MPTNDIPKRRVSVVTGANVGIGLETAVGLASFGDRVIIACRNLDKAEAARTEICRRSYSEDVEIVPLDLASFESVRACAAEIARRTDHVDVLVNNAGLILSDRDSTAEGLEMTFGVNHVGPFLLTSELEPLLRDARIVTLSSAGHWGAVTGVPLPEVVDPEKYRGWLAYARSKLANHWFAIELADRWASYGVVSNSVHPGMVRTGFAHDGDVKGLMGRAMTTPLVGPVLISAQRGADTSVWLATSEEAATKTGRYWYRRSPGHVSPKGRDRKGSAKLWDFTEELIAARS